MLGQRTVAREVSVAGIGLHSGRKVGLKLCPAPADFGIQFRRIDVSGSKLIKADIENVTATENATTLGHGNNIIHTVEHLLAAIYGLGINNVYCEISGPEIPIMDGSAASFVFLLKEAGILDLNKSKNFLVILSSVKVQVGDKWAVISPSSRLIIDSTICFQHPLIREQRELFEYSCENFVEGISRARTFGMLKDVDMLKRKGLVKGGSLDNAIVLDEYSVLNSEGLRFKDEFVRHKVLDTLGDVGLLGPEIAGRITTYKSGHHLHNVLCRKLLATPGAYKIVSASALNEEQRANFSSALDLNWSF